MIFRSTLLVSLLSLSTAFAQSYYSNNGYYGNNYGNNTSNSTQVQGRVADEAEVVKYLSKYVYELKKPYMVFHWFNNQGRNAIWSSPISASDYTGYNYVQNQGVRFYQSYCAQQNTSANPRDCGIMSSVNYGAGNMYGPGLYTAMDPATTSYYGGNSTAAVLVQIQLPKGYRVLDVVKDRQLFSQEISNYFQKENCPYLGNMEALVRLNYNYGPSANPDPCKLLIRRLLKDQLRMDGFFYSYSSTPFQGCNYNLLPRSAETDAIGNYQGPFNQRAFIIANPGKIAPGNVKVFNSQTPDARAERIKINSLLGSYNSSSILAWKDLTPQDKDPNILDWLQENVIGCKAEVPYVPAR